DRIGFFTPKESGSVVLVALRVAARDGQREGSGFRRRRVLRRSEAMQEVKEVVGIGASGVEADDEGPDAVALHHWVEALAHQRVAGGRLGEGQLSRGGLEVVLEEGGVVAVARGVDADAVAARRLRSGSRVW